MLSLCNSLSRFFLFRLTYDASFLRFFEKTTKGKGGGVSDVFAGLSVSCTVFRLLVLFFSISFLLSKDTDPAFS